MEVKMKKKLVRRSIPDHYRLNCDLPDILEKIFLARGIRTKEELENNLNHLIPFGSMLGIKDASACLVKAITENHKILIIGDFDADGATSSALAVTALRALGANQVNFLVPN